MVNKKVTVLQNDRDSQILNQSRQFLIDSIDSGLHFDVSTDEYMSLLSAVLSIITREDKNMFYLATDYKDKMNELCRAMIPYQLKNNEPEGRLLNAIFGVYDESKLL